MDQSKIFSKLFLMLLSGLALCSCGLYRVKASQAGPSDPPNANQLLNEPVGYSEVNQYIFSVSCNQCHATGVADGGVILDNFNSSSTNASAVNNEAVQSSNMPKTPVAPLTLFQRQLLAKWIQEGAPNNAPTVLNSPAPSPTPEPLMPNYQSIANNIFIPKCLICHSATGIASDNLLDSYADVIASGMVVVGSAATSPLYLKTQEGAMPPSSSGESPLSTDEVSAIQQWINEGANDN